MPHSKESRPDGCKKLSAVIHIVVVHRVIQLSHSYISFYISRHKRSGSAAFGLSAQWPCWAPSAGSALKKPCSRPGQAGLRTTRILSVCSLTASAPGRSSPPYCLSHPWSGKWGQGRYTPQACPNWRNAVCLPVRQGKPKPLSCLCPGRNAAVRSRWHICLNGKVPSVFVSLPEEACAVTLRNPAKGKDRHPLPTYPCGYRYAASS